MKSSTSFTTSIICGLDAHMLDHHKVWFSLLPASEASSCSTEIKGNQAQMMPPGQFGEVPVRFFWWAGEGPHLQHMEVPGLGVELELQLLAYATASATPEPSRVCDLHHSSWQCGILNPLSSARDGTCLLMDAGWVCYSWATTGIRHHFSFTWTHKSFAVKSNYFSCLNTWPCLLIWVGELTVNGSSHGIVTKDSASMVGQKCLTLPLGLPQLILVEWMLKDWQWCDHLLKANCPTCMEQRSGAAINLFSGTSSTHKTKCHCLIRATK